MNMDRTPTKELSNISRSVYPPSFCDWRMALGVMTVTQLSVLLIGLGRPQGITLQWLSVVSLYAQSLALSCTVVVCISRPWLKRLSIRDAWISCWLLAVLTTFGVSYSCAVVGTVLGFGPGEAQLPSFMFTSIVAVAMVFMALLRYLFIRSQWQTEILAQADARVEALQARIRPHFLFNSLNTIASLIVDEPLSAERATEDLAELFRGSMRRADTMIQLSEELSLGRRYLDMEQRRLGDRLEVEWEVDELPAQALVLPLVLQPLLENAVLHGIQPAERGGKIRVYGRGEAENIVIAISNSLPPDQGSSLRTSGNGMALINIRSRLELAFEDRASLITNQSEDQFFAVLTIPGESLINS
ncbi:MAG: two-component system sensor histidine kinase AlgZ [Lysobacterales bacterium]|jgi:two-component system sensor histidine kinase AlgZ